MSTTFKDIQTPTMSTMVKTDGPGLWAAYVTITATTKRGEHKRAVAVEMVLEWDGYVSRRTEAWSVLRTTMTTNRAGTFVIPTPLERGSLAQVTAAAVKVAQRQARKEQAIAIAECSGSLCAA